MDNKAIILIVLNIAFVFLIYITRRKKLLNNLLLSSFSFLFILTVIEFVYRGFVRNVSYYTGDLAREFFKPDSLLGYTIGKTGQITAIKKVRNDTIFKRIYTINRDTTGSSNIFNHRVGYSHPSSTKEIIFLGCSFTFGDGLEDSETLPYLTGSLAQLPSFNYGCVGYGTHQVYQFYQTRFAGQTNHKRIFIYSFLYDHILRANGVYDWNMNGPFFRSEGDSLIFQGSLQNHIKKRQHKFVRYASLFNLFTFIKDMVNNIYVKHQVKKLNSEDYERCFLMIKRMAQSIETTGGKLIVIDWDKNNWANSDINNLPVSMIEHNLSKLAGSNIRVLRVSSILNLNDTLTFIHRDGHPSSSANKKLASALENAISN